LRQTFPPHEQGMAMALYGVAVVIGPAFGPTLGGYIVDNTSWEWIFTSTSRSGARALHVSRFVHEPEDIRIAQRAMAKNSERYWIGRDCPAHVGVALAPVRARGGQRNDWFESSMISAMTALPVVAIARSSSASSRPRCPPCTSLFKEPCSHPARSSAR
jgi:DHA2 family multidrug resistance protein